MFQKLSLRLRSLFRRSVVEQELDDEVLFHVQQQTDELIRRGVPADQAALQARRQFGNVTLHKEECRDTRHLAWLENLAQDFRHSFRTLRRAPGFTVVAVLTLALGIGATTSLFSVIDAALLHPVAAPEPDRLVWLQEYSKGHNESGGNPARLADWQKARSFSAVGGFYSENAVWPSPQGPVQLQVLRTAGDFNGTLKAQIRHGRPFTAAELRGEGQPVALLTATAFHRQFQSDPKILNQTLRLGTAAYQIIGILADGTDYPEACDLWTPAPREIQNTLRRAAFLGVVARLAPGVSLKQAQSEIDVFCGRLAQQYPDTDRERSATLTPLIEHVGEGTRKPLLILFGAVSSVLLIGCVNIAGLLLARGIARRREAAIRVSVGAGYGRLVRLFFAESLLLASAGCVAGLLLSFAAVDILKASLPEEVPHLAEVAVNLNVVVCGITLALLAAVIFGALPAWQFASRAQTVALKDDRKKSPLRSLLVICEVTFSMVLLVAASLLTNSFLKLRAQPLGFNSAHAYAFTLEFPWDTDLSVLRATAADTLARLNSLPGTISCGVVDRLPLHGGSQSNVFQVRGKTLPASLAETEFGYRTASAGFFAATGIPLLSGSLYRDQTSPGAPFEAVISQRLAATLFAGENPIGHEISRSDLHREPRWFRIAGVVGSVPARANDHEPAAEIYVPWGATYWPIMNFVVRTDRPLADVSRFVHEQIQAVYPNQILSPVSTLDERTAETRSAPRTTALLVGSFALVALALSALGLFGLMTHETTRRTQEIGVRLALGAEPPGIALDAIFRAVKLVAAGLALGLGAAWYASTLLNSILFEVAPHDLLSYTTAAGILFVVAVVAALLPAMRAARINPIQALRHE